jgi:hypothetical protein
MNANLPLHARKVPSARPAMKGKAGTAAGRSTDVEPTKILFSGDGPPSLHFSVCWREKFSRQAAMFTAERGEMQ